MVLHLRMEEETILSTVTIDAFLIKETSPYKSDPRFPPNI